MVTASFLTKDLGINWQEGENILQINCWTLIFLQIMEVGSGLLPPDVTHNLTFEFLIQQARQKSSILKVNL